MKRSRWFAAAAVMVALVMAPMVRGQVLKQVPDNALVVVRFANIKQTSDKLASLATKFGIDKQLPEFRRQRRKLVARLLDVGEPNHGHCPAPA